MMSVFKKCGLFALSSILLSTGLSVLLSAPSYAASVFDDKLQITNSLRLKAQGCNDIDITYTWASYITDDTKWFGGYDLTTHRNVFNNALSNGVDWAVTKFETEDYTRVTAYFADVPLSYYFNENDGTIWLTDNNTATRIYSVQFYLYSEDCTKVVTYPDDVNFGYELTPAPIGSIFLVNISNPSTPEGYEGVIPPDEVLTPADKPTIRPDFIFQVNDKNVTATAAPQDIPDFTPDSGYTISREYINWDIWHCPGDFDTLTQTCSDTLVLINSADTNYTDPYTFSVPDYGQYIIEAEYMNEQCYRYPSWPATPDHCFTSFYATDLPNYTFTSTSRLLTIDGSSFTGDTSSLTCDVAGRCRLDTERCYALDGFFDVMNCKVQSQLSVGILNPSLNAIKALFNSFIVPPAPTCSLALSDVRLDSTHSFPLSTFPPHICAQAANFRNHFPLVVILVNFAFALLFFRLLVHIFNKLTNSDDTDILPEV